MHDRFGERLRARRNNLNWTQKELAAQSGVSERAIAGFESGDSAGPSHTVLEKLARALAVTPAWLLGGSDARPAAAELHDGPPRGADPEAVRLTLRSLKLQAASLVEQLDNAERQLCGPLSAEAAADARRIFDHAAAVGAATPATNPPKPEPPHPAAPATSPQPPPSNRQAKKHS